MEYVSIALVSLSIILLIVLIIRSFKKENKSDISKSDMDTLLKTNLELTKKDLNKDNEVNLEKMKGYVDSSITKSNNELNEKILKEQRENNDRLISLERQINNSLNDRVKGITDTLNKQVDLLNQNVNKSMTEGFKSTSEAYENLIKKLTTIDTASKNIFELSNEVIGLKSVLENNQNRGKFGEFTLERILFSVFGDTKDTYATQYSIKDNDTVNDRPDAVIFMPKPSNLLCIDSKFPFQDYKRLIEENDEDYKKEFSRAVKKHIDDVSKKYIIKGSTAAYAILFIPSDAVFGYINGVLYEIVEYARERSVVLSSPSTLQPILASINMVKIEYKREENYDEIIKALNSLSKDFKKFGEDWTKINKNMHQATNAMDEFDKRVNIMDKKFTRISDASGIEYNDSSENN